MPRSPRARRGGSRYRSARLSTILLLLTMGWGLAVRFAPLGLPRSVVKYGGSTLWALAIYWLVSAVTPSRRLPLAAMLAGCLTTAVELFKLYSAPGMDAFRHTLPGILLFGRHFSWQDIAAYWVAVLVGFLLDRHLLRR